MLRCSIEELILAALLTFSSPKKVDLNEVKLGTYFSRDSNRAKVFSLCPPPPNYFFNMSFSQFVKVIFGMSSGLNPIPPIPMKSAPRFQCPASAMGFGEALRWCSNIQFDTAAAASHAASWQRA